MSVELTVLVDNQADGALRPEHGLAVLVRGPGRTVLFDAAATAETLLANAEALGVDLSEVDTAVVSHGHYDHTGGLEAVARRRAGLNVYAHARAFSRRWADRKGRPMKDVSCPIPATRLNECGAVYHPVQAPEMLADWLILTGPIGGPPCGCEQFVIRRGGDLVSDGFEDETAALIRGRDGWAVLTGCCHRGLANTLRLARFLARSEPVTAIVGGLHLRNAPAAELDRTVSLLTDNGSPRVYPCHCTGDGATKHLAEKLPGRVTPLSAGTRLEL